MFDYILSSLYRAITPPAVTDEEEDRTAHILPRLCLGMGMGGLLVILHDILGGRWQPVGPVAMGVAALALVALLNRAGRVRVAAYLLIFAFLATIVLLLCTAGQGIRDISGLFLPVTLVAAGLLLSRRGYVLVALTTVLAADSVIIAEFTGLLVTRFSYFTTVWTLVDVTVILGITGLVVGFLTREFHRALAVARRHQADLAESRAALAGILNSVPQAIFWKDRHGVYLGCNEVFAHIVGLDRTEIIVGKTDFDLTLSKDQAEAYRAADQEVLNTNRPKRHIIEPMWRPDGTRRWINTTKVPLPDATGAPAVVLGVFEDITEQRRAEEEIRSLNEELERRVADRTARLEAVNKELETFSFSVSHDLRAPLRRIDGFSHALAEDCEATLDEQGKEYVALIRKEVRQMAQLIEDLLALSRIGRNELNRKPLDLAALAAEIIDHLRATDPNRRVEVTLPDQLTVLADENLLRIALENLLGNAWKFTRGRDPAAIELGVTRQDGRTVFFVRDNGAGFDMAYAGKLFAPFQRLHSEKQFEGTGIGLATVQRIVNRHGGRVWAHGAVDKGATVCFTL